LAIIHLPPWPGTWTPDGGDGSKLNLTDLRLRDVQVKMWLIYVMTPPTKSTLSKACAVEILQDNKDNNERSFYRATRLLWLRLCGTGSQDSWKLLISWASSRLKDTLWKCIFKVEIWKLKMIKNCKILSPIPHEFCKNI